MNSIARMATNPGLLQALVTCVGAVLLLASLLPCTLAQYGFTSIDCGNSTDNGYFDRLGLRWVSDDGFVSTGMNGKFPDEVSNTTDNYQALQSFRYFPEPINKFNKHCYELPAQDGLSLIRAMFYYENTSLLPLPIQFSLSIDATIVLTILINDSNVNNYIGYSYDSVIYGGFSTPFTYEGIFNLSRPSQENIHFCLLPKVGVPFISSIEMRAIPDGGALYADYFVSGSERYLETYYRYNCGSEENLNVRYPDDRFDRIWVQALLGNTNISQTVNSTGRVSYISDQTVNSVPPRVMVSAFEQNATEELYLGVSLLSEFVNSVYIAMYFEELVATTEVVRGMIFSLQNSTSGIISNNGSEEKILINVTANPQLITVQDVPITNHTDNFLYLDFIPQQWSDGSQMNALEIFVQYSFDTSRTSPTDEAALETVKTSFSLTNWSGDPCLPVSWEWIQCDNNVTALYTRVTKILLSNFAISGSIPPIISHMDALTEIRLDNNSLTGTIPDSLANLQNLTVLLLNNNKLTGTIPANLTTKPGLKFSHENNEFSTENNRLSSGGIAGVVVGGGVLILLAVIVTWGIFLKRRKKSGILYKPSTGVVSLKAVLLATRNNSSKIGVGSYGSVYYGNLDGKDVAVKVNGIHSDQRNQEFITEVDILTRVHHRNLVSLLGYCSEGQQLILIYEYQANGTLREWLYRENNKPPRGILKWSQRLQIAVDAAKGLEYLHKSCVPPIIHRDVKTSNILLDHNLVGKVADFGVSKSTLRQLKSMKSLSNVDQNPEFFDNREGGGYHTMVKGTFGYLDPEYCDTQILSPKCDVYSFGVVLAELLLGRPATTKSKDETPIFLMDELHDYVERDELEVVIDPNLKDDFDKESMLNVANIALACARFNGKERPDISEVVRSLEMAERRVEFGFRETFSTTSHSNSDSLPSTGSDFSNLTSTSSSAARGVSWSSATTYF